MQESFEKRIAQAMSELETTQAALAKAQEDLRAATMISRSRDRAVEVTVGPQGELIGLSFLESKYRSMSATQLAASVLEAADSARAMMARQVMEAFQPLLTGSPTVPEIGATQVDWQDIFGGVDLEGVDGFSVGGRLRDELSEDEEG
ncbi:YbaB/EbfC family nucleoid-associated protein [Streptomyces zhihengii]|uniref:YbaB/EbfC family nucleoid-associated protein n=1 Tax=Streptomyces zhihengii TaxID=1818004 RepID=A0ABS2V435_9ACTN|nr:YbaB/EbfC family nucleoid-associated protein [Streptomyces zhihengii]MBM9624505.1 YbaB/EbfC family nucleoid-associated protein [Streptomyces zhihengii]